MQCLNKSPGYFTLAQKLIVLLFVLFLLALVVKHWVKYVHLNCQMRHRNGKKEQKV